MSVAEDVRGSAAPAAGQDSLQRGISWRGAFWIASGVPAAVLVSIGAIAATVGTPSWVVWFASISMGFLQAFTYAEIAGMFPHKSGGASVYGAVAWGRYGKAFAPFSVWCNWVAWSPVLAIGSGLAAGYILSILFAPDATVNTWQLTLVDLNWLKDGLTIRLNATFFIGVIVLLAAFAIQHGGIASTAKAQAILAVAALLPLMIIGIVPLITGDIVTANLAPRAPIAFGANGEVETGRWGMAGITLFAGALFIAAWSTYAFETAVCYTREFKDPKRDTFKAILYSGFLCMFIYTLVPISFQGVLGLGEMVSPAVIGDSGEILEPAVYDGMLAPDIASGMGVAKAMASMIQGGYLIENIVILMLVLSLGMTIVTSMAGSSRTLYQASVDGLLPRYLSKVNSHGAPTSAMWTDLGFNLILLMMSDYVFVLAIANVNYILFNFMNLNAGWIMRRDRPTWTRPFKAPNWLLGTGGVLAFVNLALLGFGADVWGSGTLLTGIAVSALVLPIFFFRHYVVDKGAFPKTMQQDLSVYDPSGKLAPRSKLPYLALALGITVVLIAYGLADYG